MYRNQIGYRQQCPGPGVQIITASYTLPQGSLQAVRANLMYGSNTASASAASCTSGGYDDTDDLVITVRPNQHAVAQEAVFDSGYGYGAPRCANVGS